MEAASLLLNVAMLGTQTPQGVQTGQQATEGGDAASSVFGELVAKLLEQSGITTGTENVGAGQQVEGQKKDDAKADNNQVDAQVIAQAQCLLGSMGTVQDVPDTAVLKYESVPESVDIVGNQTATIAISQTGIVPTQNKTMPSQTEGVQTAEAQAIPAVSTSQEGEKSAPTEVVTENIISQSESLPNDSIDQTAGSKANTVSPEAQVKPTDTPVTNQSTKTDVELPISKAEKPESSDKPAQVILGDQVAVAPVTEQSTPDVVKSALAGELQADQTQTREATTGSDVVGSANDDRSIEKPSKQSRSKYAELFGVSQQVHQTATAGNQSAPVASPTSTLKVGPEATKDRIFDPASAKKMVTTDQKPVNLDQQPSWMQATAPAQGFRAVEAAEKSQGHLPPAEVVTAKVIHQIVKSAKVNVTELGGNMTLRLDPPHLGSVNMNVSVAEGVVTASIETTTESARQVLQADLATLKEALASSGVHVDSINVTVGGQNQTWQHSNSGGQGSPTEGRQQHGAWNAHANHGPEIAPEPVMATSSAYGAGLNFLA